MGHILSKGQKLLIQSVSFKKENESMKVIFLRINFPFSVKVLKEKLIDSDIVFPFLSIKHSKSLLSDA